MAKDLQFTEDELSNLHLLLSQEIEVTRVELHHTSRARYREILKQRLEQDQALLRKMEDALPQLAQEH